MNCAPDSEGRVLIVEDEPRLAGVLCDYLNAAGFVTDWVADGAEAMAAIRRLTPDLLLLDLMLPNRDGVELCRELRLESDMPVIMVTARAEEIDRLLGLEVGADDYICKPFSPREVVARVQAVLRRHRRDPGVPTIAELQIDVAACRASWRGLDLDLTQVEFRLLHTLAGAPGRVYSRDQLMDRLYSDRRIVTDRTVDSHVRNLRRKLAAAGGEDWIKSIYGVGYRFEE
ncbi:MAG: response regulator [Proteobacteria bacterium]|nr:response regulator [Pseudomonadota bacterium]